MEPSLSELVNISPETVAPPIIDNTKIVEDLNRNARFHAENQWKKYNAFLDNKKDLFKNISDIQGLAVAPQDREALKKEAGEILSDILKNPAVALGGKGYDEVQSKILKFKGNSMLSKQNKLDDDTNGMFMDRNPELYTEENQAKRENFWKLPLGSRESVLLDMPTIFDEKKTFDEILKTSTQPYTSVVGADGKAGEGYIESGNEVNPSAINDAWKLALRGQKDKYGHSIYNAVKLNYDKLPDEEKQKYESEGGGGIEQYFADRGKQYVDAYFPEGTYEKTKEGTYRFGKKLVADPNYLGKERLEEQTRYHNAQIANARGRLALGWANHNLAEERLNEEDEEDLLGADTVLNEATSILKNATPRVVVDRSGTKKTFLRISDPTLLQTFGNVDKDGNVANVPDAINYDKETNQAILLYYGKKGKTGTNYEKEVPVDQRTWLKNITKRSFPNKDIGKINSLLEDVLKQNDNDLYGISKKLSKKPDAKTTTPPPAPKAGASGVKWK